MKQNLIEKIAQAHAVGLPSGSVVHSGDFLTVRPAHVMTHDNTSPVMAKFASIGVASFADPAQPIFTIDHDVQNLSEANQDKYKRIEAFAAEHGVRFFPPGRGIGHQVMCEEGFVLPGTMVVASDSHSNIYGGLGALGTPVVRTDAAGIWATSESWYQVPPVTRVELTGELGRGVAGKDVIIALCGQFNQDEVLNHALEFAGPGVANLSIEARLAIANMTTEWGALAGVFPTDAKTHAWLAARLEAAGGERLGDLTPERLEAEPLAADAGATYVQTIHLDLARVAPGVSGPHQVKVRRPLDEVAAEGVAIQKAYLLSCANGRAEDLAEAARTLRAIAAEGRPAKVAAGVEFYVAPASTLVQAAAEAAGDWQTLIDAGARPLPAGCGPCIGLGTGLLEPGEVGISATNRNFKGRMGDASAEALLASPAVVAASAIAGRVAAPPGGHVPEDGPAGNLERHDAPPPAAREVEILQGFPSEITGEMLFLDADNLNTDGIYGKDVTYQDGLTPDQMAAAAMLNYDPAFQELAQSGDVLVSGFNFGTGSSREQAATCLKYKGLALVLAGSFSETYKRNAFNNGYICLECPALVESLRARFEEQLPTRRTGLSVRIDFRAAVLEFDGVSLPLSPLGPAAQALVLAGGLEAQLRACI
jgi:homoaconitate hydratase